MAELYLITGFLGSGKSTFLKNFIRLFEGKRIQLIINEFGREGVDGTLLAGLGISLEEITGGSVFCSCRIDQFEKALRVFVREDTEVVLVEASGLSDPTGVRRLLGSEGRFSRIGYRGCICLVDAVRFPKIYAKSRTCVKQLASSDVVLINKTDAATKEQLEKTQNIIAGQRPDVTVYKTAYGAVDGSMLSALKSASLREHDGEKMSFAADISMRSLTITVSPAISVYRLEKFISMFADAAFRVKGFVQTKEGLMTVSCVGNALEIEPFAGSVSPHLVGKLVVLSGLGMPIVKRVKEAAAWYQEDIIRVEV